MVAQEAARRRMTIEEWRELERTSHDAKHEYIDGWVTLMSGGSFNHGRIGSNVVRLFEDALAAAGSPCRVYNSGVAARLSARHYTYPDATVTCDERDRGTGSEIQGPRVVVEVLSDSTEAYDRGDKFEYYRACPAVHEYVLVGTKRQSIEVFRRTPQGWTACQVYHPGDEIALTSLDACVRIPLSAFYRDTTVPETLALPEGEV